MDGVKRYLFCIGVFSIILCAVPGSVFAQAYVCHDSTICVSYDTSLGGYPGEGHFGIGHADGRRLTYAYSPPIVPWDPGQSETHFVLRVDDFRFTNWETYFTFCGGEDLRDFPMTYTITEDPPEIITTWEVREGGPFNRYDFTLQQKLSPCTFYGVPQVRIEYSVTNNLYERINVGLILFIDTRLGPMDRPLMDIGYAVVDTGSIWNNPYIPYYYRGYEDYSDPAALVMKGYLREGDCTPPDVFAVGQASGLSHICWEVRRSDSTSMLYGLPYGDVGVFMRWNWVALTPGLSRSFITYYGLGERLDFPHHDGLIMIVPETLDIECEIVPPEECMMLCPIVCNDDPLLRDYDSVTICIHIPDTLHYALDSVPPYSSDTCMLASPSYLEPGEIGAAGWRLCLTDPGYYGGIDTLTWRAFVASPWDVDTVYDTTFIVFPPPAPSCTLCGALSGVLESEYSPYFVTCDVYVPTDSSLHIEPGCSIIFLGHYKFAVDTNAVMKAIGTETNSIIFTAVDTHITDSSGGHHGIRFYSAAEGCTLSYCLIEYGNALFSTGEYLHGDYDGGGIYCIDTDPYIDPTLTLYRNTISSNFALNGGGIYCENATVNINSNKISGNHSKEFAGGVYCCDCYAFMDNNVISGNSADTLGGGICIYSVYSVGQIEGNIICNNSGCGGGGIFCYGVNVQINNNLIKGNNCPRGCGGGICLAYYIGGVVNNTIVENSASFGGGISCLDSTTGIFLNNIIWNNNASIHGNEFSINSWIWGIRGPSNPLIAFTNVDSEDCYIEVSEGYITWELGNINENPLFTDTLCHLSPFSPCIDIGTGSLCIPWGWIDAPLEDIEGEPRPMGSGWDIGAYEYQFPIPPPDTIHTLVAYVSDAITSAPLPTITINAYNFYGGDLVTTDITNASGLAYLDVPEGTYALVAYDLADRYYPEFYEEAHTPGLAAPVAVNETSPDTITGFDFTLDTTASHLSISGTIRDDELNPLDAAFAIVVSSEEGEDWTETSVTGHTGEYEIFVPPGEYHCLAFAFGYVPLLYDHELYWDSSEVVGITTYSAAGIDFTLPDVPSSSEPDTTGSPLEGGVFEEMGTAKRALDTVPLPGVRVYLKDTDSPAVCYIGVYSGLEGEFTFNNLPEGSYQLIADKIFYTIHTENIEVVWDSVSEYITIVLSRTSGISGDLTNLPARFTLNQNYPNPFNSSTVILYSLPTASDVKFEVFNILGEKVETLVDEKQVRGAYLIKWQPNDLGSGIYWGRLSTGMENRIIRILYMK